MSYRFSAREIAELANVSVRAVDRATEDKALAVIADTNIGRRRTFPLYAVAYTAIVTHLQLSLPIATKRQIAKALSKRTPAQMTVEPLHLAPAVTLDVAALVGKDLAERAERYGRARDELIESDPDIMGGLPMIKAARITVFAIEGRLNAGDTVDSILGDYPFLSREVVETAEFYARTHPMTGRKRGRSGT